MKSIKFYLCAALALMLLPGCQKLDWNDVDYGAHVTIKQVDLPFATIKVQISDLLGMVDSTMLTTDPQTGVLMIQNEFDIEEKKVECPFSTSDLATGGSMRFNLLSNNPELGAQFAIFQEEWQEAKELYNLYPEAPETQIAMAAFESMFGYPFVPTDNSVHFSGAFLKANGLEKLDFEFPVSLTFNSLAQNAKIRLDSALFTSTVLTNHIHFSDGMELPWNMVKTIELTLGEQFYRTEGNHIYLYRNGVDDPATFGWDKNFPFTLGEFSLCLMNNRNPQPSDDLSENNVYTINVTVNVHLEVADGDIIALGSSDPYVDYNLSVNMDNLTAVWGMFDAEEFSKFNVKQTVDLSKVWNTISQAGVNANLPFDDPRIQFDLNTKGIAGHLLLNFKDLYTTDKNGGKHQADPIDVHIDMNLDKSTIGQTHPTHIALNNTEKGGSIHKLFEGGEPQEMVLGASLNINKDYVEMVRVEQNIAISGRGSMQLPFSFSKGIELSTRDTLKGLDLSVLSTDSIRSMTGEMVSLNSAEVKIVIEGTNSIPETLDLSLIAEDKDNNKVWSDAVSFPAAIGDQPTICTDSLQISKENLDQMKNVDHLIYSVRLANSENPSAIKPDQNLKLKISLSVANVNADINLNPSK